jgi:Zn-dependent peptidase ImmA (M78 family)
LHRHISQEDLDNKSVRDHIESEANMFAGSFLLPRDSMLREFYSTRLNHLKGLKARWRVSIQAIAHRCKDIGIMDEYQYILFRKQISFNRWQKKEPLDDTIPLEQPEWLLGVEDELGFSLDLVVRLFGHSAIGIKSQDSAERMVRLSE